MPTEKANSLFSDFSEFYHFTRDMSSDQRQLIYSSLPRREQNELDQSCLMGGWSDVYIRDQLNRFLEQFEIKYGLDMLYLRVRVLSGKSVYMPTEAWRYLAEYLSEYSPRHTTYITGGIEPHVCDVNKEVVLLLKKTEKVSRKR